MAIKMAMEENGKNHEAQMAIKTAMEENEKNHEAQVAFEPKLEESGTNCEDQIPLLQGEEIHTTDLLPDSPTGPLWCIEDDWKSGWQIS